jgi:energy-coupling factor transport system ATP-binding protein
VSITEQPPRQAGDDAVAADPPISGPLRPGELAEAAVMADLAVLIVVLARLTPFSGLTTVVGAIPFAVLGLRHRFRVMVVAFLVGVILTFLLAGFSASTQVLVMATFGGVVGRGTRFGWSRTTTITMAIAVGWTTVATLTLGYLWVFGELRQLAIDAASSQWSGLRRFLDGVGLGVIGDGLDPAIQWGFANWFVAVPTFQLVISVAVTGLILQIGRPTIHRVDAAFGPPSVRVADPTDVEPRPVPLALVDAVVERGQQRVVLPDLTLSRPEFVTIEGPNGAGKSTLLAVLVERLLLDEGWIERAGPVGLGIPGGTAVIGQRPESQVVGARVSDDLAWGLDAPPTNDEAARVLADVGLEGFEQRETAGLSGGELQRLAIAAALLREPSLLLSDESTAMLDPQARERVLEVLASLGRRAVVVHVTHLAEESADADRSIRIEPS